MSADAEERDLTQTEIALNRVRVAAYTAMTCGASRSDIDREVATAAEIIQRSAAKPPTRAR
jgi:hypothetical protein